MREANILWAHFILACERVSGRGGAHGWEHPEDLGCDPFPSIWCTPEMLKLEQRTGSKRARFVSACWGPRSERARRNENVQCPGIGVEGHHHSGCSEGTDSSGHFFTRRLQTYPPRMCEELARMIVDTAQRMLRTGGTNWASSSCGSAGHSYGLVVSSGRRL